MFKISSRLLFPQVMVQWSHTLKYLLNNSAFHPVWRNHSVSTMQRHSKWTPLSSVKHPAMKPTGQNTPGKPRWPLKGAFPCLVFYFSVSECQWEILRGILAILCSLLGSNWTLPEEKLQLTYPVNIPLQAERDNFNLAVQYQTCVLLLSKLQVKVWLPLGLSKFECEQKLRELTFELQITASPSGLRIIINVIDF